MIEYISTEDKKTGTITIRTTEEDIRKIKWLLQLLAEKKGHFECIQQCVYYSQEMQKVGEDFLKGK